jgi:hypothetical protein
VDDVLFVAVVDTREDLLHEDGSIFLSELASCDDFIEEFSSFADPRESIGKCLLGHNVVTLLILEEFVHFHDVRVVLKISIYWPFGRQDTPSFI